MMTLTLSASERQQLEATCKTMADRRRQPYQIAHDVGVSTRTVQRWLNASAHSGLEGLTIQWASGRAPHIPAELIPESLTWITAGPAGCGLDRANWT
jgi:transposase